jgi:CheY-like chemotaxis protein
MEELPKWKRSPSSYRVTWMGFLFAWRAPMKTIMIIDDDANVRRSVRYVLKSHGYRVFEASSGADALQQLHKEPVDLVILDLVMPQVDGTMVCDQIKSDPTLSAIPVVIFTVMREEICRDWKRYMKANAFLIKPFQVGELLTTINELLGGSINEGDTQPGVSRSAH